MPLLHQYMQFLTVFVVFKEILCVCQESHVVICDELTDIYSKQNETTTWKYVQIGSLFARNVQPNEVFNHTILFNLPRTKALTIINRVNFVKMPFTLVYLTQMEYLNLYDNNIIEIEDFSFENSKTVREFYLKNNDIQHLGRGIFKNTTLDIVDISQNRIQSITTCFYYSTIKWILLNHNKIKFIKAEAFPSNLEQLELNNNLIESLDDKVFKNLINLKELYLEHNLLTTIPGITPLKNIHYLHFAHNKLKEVHYRFDQHHSLEYIDLTCNSIRNVTTDIFSGLPLVLLSFNRLTNIVFEHPEKRTDLFLYGNPWNCDCLFHIERILSENKHMESCDIKDFEKGHTPLCIENGKCGLADISKEDIDRFLDVVSVREKEIQNCVFRL